MISYYIIPILVNIIVGTVAVFIITRSVGFPNATVPNAFFIIAGGTLLLIFRDWLFPEEFFFSWILMIVVYYFLISVVYKAPYFKVFILWLLTIVLRITITLAAGAHFTDFARYIIF